ncbi:MAG: hypothetical protein ABUL60_06685 [Myxococcales bacterium]
MTDDGRARLAWLRLAGGLLLTPAVVAVALLVLPQLRVGTGAANVISFAGATGVAIAGLALASTAELSRRLTLAIAALGVATLVTVAVTRASNGGALLATDTALVGVAWALGASLGRRVQHASHLLPACVVAASADVVSLVSPEGPSHAIANSDRALSVLAIWFPVPASTAWAPALGVGDLLFIALVLGVAVAHELPYARVVLCCAVGTALAGVAAAISGVAVPALLPIAGAVIVGLPAARRLRAVDRRAARWSMLIAASVAAATVVRHRVSSGEIPSGSAPPIASASSSPIIHSAPGLPPGDYTLIAERPGIRAGSVLTSYQQMHLGYPVSGAGFFVSSKDGWILGKNGRLIEGLPSTYPTPMSEERARELAWRAQEVDVQPPWLAEPSTWHPPHGQLAWVSVRDVMKASDYVLAWCFDFHGTGVGRYINVTLNAATGELVSRNPGMVN